MCPGSSITRIYFASQQTIAIHYLLINSRILNHIHTSERVEFKAGFRVDVQNGESVIRYKRSSQRNNSMK